MRESPDFSERKRKIIGFVVKFLPKSPSVIDKFDSFYYIRGKYFLKL